MIVPFTVISSGRGGRGCVGGGDGFSDKRNEREREDPSMPFPADPDALTVSFATCPISEIAFVPAMDSSELRVFPLAVNEFDGGGGGAKDGGGRRGGRISAMGLDKDEEAGGAETRLYKRGVECLKEELVEFRMEDKRAGLAGVGRGAQSCSL